MSRIDTLIDGSTQRGLSGSMWFLILLTVFVFKPHLLHSNVTHKYLDGSTNGILSWSMWFLILLSVLVLEIQLLHLIVTQSVSSPAMQYSRQTSSLQIVTSKHNNTDHCVANNSWLLSLFIILPDQSKKRSSQGKKHKKYSNCSPTLHCLII